MKLLAGLLSVSSAACSPVAPAGPPAAPARGAAKPVLVTIVIDQLAAWVVSERIGELPADGGFARLRREGAWVRAMRYEHAVTDTAPGHAALYTGAVPAVSGIFANEVLGEGGEPEAIVRDAASRLIGSEGPIDRPGSSLEALRVETLADRVRAEHADAVIVSLSLKDRGALPGGGRHPTATIWFDVKGDRFVTSTAVAAALPRWAGAPLTEALRRAEASSWTPLDPAWVAGHAATPDAEAGEGEIPGFGTVFPHSLATARPAARAFRTSPFADDVLFDLGLSALDAEGGGQHETLLALSLSANDYIGHTFGPDSWEAWDELSRLDRSLARFFRGLDGRFGPDGYSVLLSADHGTTAMPEVGRHRYCDATPPDPWRRACGPAHRVMPQELGKALIARSREVLGPGDWVTGVSDPYLYLTPAALALDAPRHAALDAALRRTILAVPGVLGIDDVASIPPICPPFDDESADALVCRSVAPAARVRGAAYYVVLAPGSFFDPTVVVGKGTSHGSPYLYDRTVPLLARAPGRVAPGRVVESATFPTFVRTAAALLGVAPPHDAAPGGSLTGEVEVRPPRSAPMK